MNKRLPLIISLFFVFFIGVNVSFAAQKVSLKDAFLEGNKKTIKKEYSYLAISPIVTATALGVPKEISEYIQTEVINGLEKEGFKILPAKAYEKIEQEFAALYKNYRAKDKAKINALIQAHTYRELYFQYPVDGYISLTVAKVPASFLKDKATWHGTSQKIKHKGDGALSFITGGKDYSGHIAASSIKLTISNRDGKPIYHWAGGVEVLMSRNGAKLEQLPSDAFWQDNKRVSKAIKYLLKPI